MTRAFIIVAVFLQGAQMPAPAPAVPPGSGTAVVRGRVTDRETGRPIERALVTLRLQRANRIFESLTRADGSYEFTGLPAGPVQLSAIAGEHRKTHLPGDFTVATPAGGPTTTILLKDGEALERADIVLSRAFAINGRVVDETGEPLAGAMVRLMRVPNYDATPGRYRETDDLGRFRIFSVSPGRYFVCVHFQYTVSFDAARGDARRRLPRPTCYPSATGDEPGTAVLVSDADVEGLEIRATRYPTITISGSVMTASGEPGGGAQVWLTTLERNSSSGTGMKIGADGRLTISNVVPGRYVLSADTGGEPSPSGPRGDFEYGEIDLGMVAQDVDGLVLAMKAPVRVRGRIVFENEPELPAPSRLMVSAESRNRGGGARGGRPQAVGADLAFELTNLFGPQLVQVAGLPTGWIVKGVRYRDRDITDTWTELRTGPDALEITVTNRGAVLSGRVIDDVGTGAVATRVFVFPAAAERRQSPPARYAVSASKDGRFTASPRRAGDYLVVAVSAADAARLTDERGYDALAREAERVTLLENDRRTIDLRVVKLPDERDVR